MPYNIEKIRLPEHLDRRVKLTSKQKDEIRERYLKGGCSHNSLALEYGVSKRLISMIVNPDTFEKAKQRFVEHWKEYQRPKAERTESIRNTRRYKQKCHLKGLI